MALITITEISVIMKASYNTACVYIRKHSDFPKEKERRIVGTSYVRYFDENEVTEFLAKINYSSEKGRPLPEDNRKFIPERYNIKTPERKYPAEFSPIELMRLKQWGIKHELVC